MPIQYAVELARMLRVMQHGQPEIRHFPGQRLADFEIAEVLRDLQRLKGDKELYFGDRKMLDKERTLLVKEIDVSTNSKEVKI